MTTLVGLFTATPIGEEAFTVTCMGNFFPTTITLDFKFDL